MKVLVTGSSGLIGSTAVRHWDALGAEVIGVDNDMRGVFFGDQGKPYTIYGYGGKQVRDQIDSTDVIAALEAFWRYPRPGEVYNLGGAVEIPPQSLSYRGPSERSKPSWRPYLLHFRLQKTRARLSRMASQD